MKTKRTGKKSSFTFSFCHMSPSTVPAVSVHIYLRNRLCVGGVNRLTSGWSTIKKKQSQPGRPVRKGCEGTLDDAKGCDDGVIVL